LATSASGARTAVNLEAAGVNVVALINASPEAETRALNARIFNDALVTRADGRSGLRAVSVRHANGLETVEIDALAMSGGFSPRIHLACHRGGRPLWSEAHQAFWRPRG
jgi:NADPH-dependent 2,4-dienoyl-CoA reductase/sulfur reductase-like enzyme